MAIIYSAQQDLHDRAGGIPTVSLLFLLLPWDDSFSVPADGLIQVLN